MSCPEAAPSRSEPREILELKQLKNDNPELTDAVDLQLAIMDLQRRVRARLAHPVLQLDETRVSAAVARGEPLLGLDDLAIDWAELRRLLQRAADLLARMGAVERPQAHAIRALGREADALTAPVARWFSAPGAARREAPARDGDADDDRDVDQGSLEVDQGSLDQVLLVAMRPFLVRSAEALFPSTDLSEWSRGYCPACGGDAEMAVITRDARRRLVCSRCSGEWDFDPMACPGCGNEDKARITSFAARIPLPRIDRADDIDTDRRVYRIAACDVCLRYIKVYDARQTTRPLTVEVDAIATLPLDAAAIQKGYRA